MKPDLYGNGAVQANLCQERNFASFDGTELFYRHWPAVAPTALKKAIVLFHRGHEHGGRMAHVVDELGMRDYAYFAWDARGLGRSPGARGHADNFGVLAKDADAFVRHISGTYGIPIENIVVIAQSVGAAIAAAWVHDYAPKIRCLILAAPAFKVKLYVPFARTGLSLLQKLRGNFYVNSYVKANYLTHDAQRIASYNADPLITRPIAVNLLLDLYRTAERVISDAAAIQVPTQVLISGADWVVHQAPQRRFLERLGSPLKECHVSPGFYHDTLGEKDRELAFAKIRSFIERMFASAHPQVNLLEADQRGYTRQEFDRLAQSPGSVAAKLYWTLTRFGIRVGAWLSDGMKLSAETGFDSGSTLDYIYRNRSSGRMGIGKLVDRIYLDSIGWRGIRQRKVHLERLINAGVDRLMADGKAVRVVDIAAGHGRYILEALEQRKADIDRILLRDYSARNVESGQQLIAEKQMQAIAGFVQADAFDRESLAAITPRPTLAVVSGLYELFPENRLIRNSLAGLADAVESGGYLVYTGQPWHPQLEMIARALTSHRQGQPWVMRRRTQLEMDQLVEDAGFEKLDQLTDEWGIFTVSIARRK